VRYIFFFATYFRSCARFRNVWEHTLQRLPLCMPGCTSWSLTVAIWILVLCGVQMFADIVKLSKLDIVNEKMEPIDFSPQVFLAVPGLLAWLSEDISDLRYFSPACSVVCDQQRKGLRQLRLPRQLFFGKSQTCSLIPPGPGSSLGLVWLSQHQRLHRSGRRAQGQVSLICMQSRLLFCIIHACDVQSEGHLKATLTPCCLSLHLILHTHQRLQGC
jgi:hypothetical protein